MATVKAARRRKSSLAGPASAARPARPAKPLGYAMVGHAFMGRAHANAVRQAGHFFDLPFEIVPRVVVGRSAERAAAAAAALGFAEGTTDLDAVLARDDIDVVDVATPNGSHYEIAMAALRAGKHVLCEKPLAMTSTQARALVREAKKRGLRTGL